MDLDVADAREDRSEDLEAGRFEVLVSEQTPSLYRFALALTRDPYATEDLVQETFLRAFEGRGTFRGEASVGTWLHRILHNLAVDRARRPEREVLVGDVEAKWQDDAYTVDAAAVAERAESREELEDALVRLPFIYRSAVVLHDVEGWTVKEIAEAQGGRRTGAPGHVPRGTTLVIHPAQAPRTARAGPGPRRSSRASRVGRGAGSSPDRSRAADHGQQPSPPFDGTTRSESGRPLRR